MTRVLKLEAKGFKSFADKTDLVFGDDFNVIIGPNGSGKSNVFDSLCFVLGKSGAKGLRADKSANLIYNGGKKGTPAKQGEVSIYLDNSEKVFPLDTDVVKVTRIIKPSGQSVYKINDTRHTRDQVIELLGLAGIDPNGYNIILQGDIVRLVEMTPNERRGIIEEIGGISVYEDKKQKAERELLKIENNLNEAEIILSERKVYLKELKKERDQAISYKDLNERLLSLKGTIINLDLSNRESEIDKLNSSNDKFKDKISVIQESIDALKSNVEIYKKEISDINKEIELKGEKTQVELHKQIELLKVDLAKYTAQIDGLNNEISRVVEQKKSYKDSLNEITSKSNSFQKEIDSLKKELDLNRKQQDQIKEKIQKFRQKNNLDNASELDKEVDVLDQQAEESEKEIYEIRSKQQDLIREKDRLELQIESADEKINKVLEVSKQNKSDIDLLKELKKNFKQATVDLQKSLVKDQSFVSQISTARNKLNSATEELAKLRVRQVSANERLGSNNAIKAIISNKNKFNGVYGTVSELGTVDSKYSVALDTSAGSRLNGIVVKDDKVAADCIRFLREQKLGVASFLPLNKIKGPDKSDLPDANGVVSYAIDLVKFDPKFRAVFKYVFGNTLVVQNIDVARRIGIGSRKMVTLDGDMAEASGAMRGGFSRRKSGSGFQDSQVNDKIDLLDKKVQDSQMMLQHLEEERGQNLDLIEKLRHHKANLEGDIIKKEKSLHLESDDLEISQKLKKEFASKLQEVDKDLIQINMLISNKNRELASIKIKKQEIKSKIMDIKNPTKLAELNTYTSTYDSLKSKAFQIEAEISAKSKQIDSTYKDEIDKLTNQISSLNEEESKLKQEIVEYKDKIKLLKVDLKEKESKEKEFYAKFKEIINKRNKFEDKLTKEEDKIIKKEDEIRVLEHKNTSISLELARLTAERDAFVEEMKQYDGVPLLDSKNKEQMKKEAWSVDQKLSRLGNVNLKALEVYDRVETEFNKLLSKKDILIDERGKVLLMINELDSKKKDIFMKIFDVINSNFQKVFQILSSKGQVELVLEDKNDPFNGGVMIKVRLKGKKFLDVRSLSGGEKALTALAFIFAVQEHNPAPFYIFDEVDAALDKRNSEKLASLIDSYSDRAQYIVVSHNDGLIGRANTLYGVSMDEKGKSKVVSLKI